MAPRGISCKWHLANSVGDSDSCWSIPTTAQPHARSRCSDLTPAPTADRDHRGAARDRPWQRSTSATARWNTCAIPIQAIVLPSGSTAASSTNPIQARPPTMASTSVAHACRLSARMPVRYRTRLPPSDMVGQFDGCLGGRLPRPVSSGAGASHRRPRFTAPSPPRPGSLVRSISKGPRRSDAPHPVVVLDQQRESLDVCQDR